MNPAFIAQQPGHSVLVLFSTYARWINPTSGRGEPDTLESGIKSASAKTQRFQTIDR